ncbi:hypothetical protein CMUS01_01853 [Colletotrichum musicola]|uniref:Uncharacterized protein n=1 Tax=Colletotrichum musicola TaxID=2175873 RepID=A0A8H6NW52_9PEZI|nr:hypothetical protein CMUS01_01853 [Colletotrichum musicola]
MSTAGRRFAPVVERLGHQDAVSRLYLVQRLAAKKSTEKQAFITPVSVAASSGSPPAPLGPLNVAGTQSLVGRYPSSTTPTVLDIAGVVQ